jgi:hypothetical protein
MIPSRSFHFLFLLSGCLCAVPAVGQESLSPKPVVLSTSIIEYFPNPKLNTVNVNLGAELYLRNNYSLYLNTGLLLSNGPSGNNYYEVPAESSHGYKFRLEGRRYLNHHKVVEPAMLLFWPHVFQYHSQEHANSGFYLGLSSTYQWTQTDRKQSVVDYIDYSTFPQGITVYKDNVYSVDRSAIGLNLLIGYQCIKKGNFTLDYAVGFGFLYINSQYRNRQGTDQDYPNSTKEWPMDKYFDYGTGISPNLLYQLRMGWAFN